MADTNELIEFYNDLKKEFGEEGSEEEMEKVLNEKTNDLEKDENLLEEETAEEPVSITDDNSNVLPNEKIVLDALKAIANAYNVPKYYYSLNMGPSDDASCIEKIEDKWIFYYYERGNKRDIEEFPNVKAAGKRLLENIIDSNEIKNAFELLDGILIKMNVSFEEEILGDKKETKEIIEEKMPSTQEEDTPKIDNTQTPPEKEVEILNTVMVSNEEENKTDEINAPATSNENFTTNIEEIDKKQNENKIQIKTLIIDEEFSRVKPFEYADCDNLKYLAIMVDVPIGGFAFVNCKNLEFVSIENEKEYTDDELKAMFMGCDNIKSIYMNKKFKVLG